MRIHYFRGTVKKVTFEDENLQILEINERSIPAYLFKRLVPPAGEKDAVILNTTATDLKLGTGGFDLVVFNLTRAETVFLESEDESHVMKLNYLPYQFSVPFIEETDEYQKAVRVFTQSTSSEDVLLLTVHSQIIPSVAGALSVQKNLKVTLIITDSSSLPVFLSNTVKFLLDNGLIENVISTGNAFGGTLEAMNIYTALIYSKYHLNSDLIIIAPGFGLKGTGSIYGHSNMTFADALNTVSSVGMKPYLVPRISFAEKRERHLGISHHTREIVQRALTKPFLFLPEENCLNEQEKMILSGQLEEIKENTQFIHVDIKNSLDNLLKYSRYLISMGRKFEDDPIFFSIAFAAGRYIAGGKQI